MTTPLEYQTPDTPTVDPVYAKMRNQEIGSASLGSALLLGGIGITLVTLLIITSLICIILVALTGDTWIGFYGWFLVLLVLLVPYLILLEKRTHGQYWADSVSSAGVDWGNYSSAGDYQYQSFLATIYMYAEFLLIGPRMLIGGYQRVRGIEAKQFDLFLGRCGTLVKDLGAMGGSSPAVKLAKPGETPAILDKILKHLDKRDWIGFSSDKTRVWLSSQAKNDLIKWGLMAYEP